MSVKLRKLAEMDPEYAEMLAEFFSEQGIGEAEYLNMTLEQFIELCERKAVEYYQVLMGAIWKLEFRS